MASSCLSDLISYPPLKFPKPLLCSWPTASLQLLKPATCVTFAVPRSGMLFSQISSWLAPSPPSCLCLDKSFSEVFPDDLIENCFLTPPYTLYPPSQIFLPHIHYFILYCMIYFFIVFLACLPHHHHETINPKKVGMCFVPCSTPTA